MRVVLDCNILVMSLKATSAYYPIYKAFLKEKYTLLLSQLIIHEYFEIITQKYGFAAAESFNNLLEESENVVVKNIYFNWNLIEADPDDNKYCDCYVAGSADYLVSQDRHFNVLASVRFPGIKVISIDEFLTILNQSGSND